MDYQPSLPQPAPSVSQALTPDSRRVACSVLNRMTRLGMPVSQRIA
jgi:hypothetical protein